MELQRKSVHFNKQMQLLEKMKLLVLLFLLKLNARINIFNNPYHSSSNGSAERAAQIFKNGMRKMSQINNSILFGTLLLRFLCSYRNIPHTQIGKIPSEMLFNGKVNTRFNMINPNPDSIKKEQKFLLSQTSSKFRIL